MTPREPNGEKCRNKEEELHGPIGISNLASFIERKMIVRRMRRTIEVNERIADLVLEGMVDWVATLVPNCAFVERYGFSFYIGEGRSGA